MRDTAKKANGEKRAMDVSCSANGKKATGSKKDDDGSFPVKIQGAGVEAFELQVHGFWLVQDAIVTLLGREEVAPRSSVALALSGVTLDPMTELQDVKGFKAGVTLRLVEEPYSPRSAQAHLARVQEMLKAVRPQDALMEGRSPAVLNTLTQTAEAPPTLHSSKNKRANSKTEQSAEVPPPPAYILPGVSELPPLTILLPTNTHSEAPSYLLDLSLSCWNPPPGFRKLQGDFMYISVHTLEGKQCDITSCPRGFYINRSTLEVFDPRPAQSTPVCHCLTDLLSHISPQFKHNLSSLRHRPSLPAEETLSTPYRTLSWLGVSSLHSHKPSFRGRLGLDQDLNVQAADWNKELQAARDLPQRSLEERLQRDRALLQVNSAFVWAVAQAAEKVIDGFVDSVNASHEDPAFLCGGVFMSMPAHRDHWLGGERSHRAAQRHELRCVQAYSDLEGDLQNLHTIPTALADYRGVRLSAQGLAPGIQGPEQAEIPNGLLYGYSAGPLENPSRRKLLELLAQSAKALSLQRHVVLGPTGHQLPLFTSVDAQGILGADGRYYLLDVYRTMPADANFHVEDEGAVTEEGSFPRRYPHVLCRLRPELVKAFIQHKHAQFSQRVKTHMEENEGVEECMKSADSLNIDAVRKACKDVGSISDIIFEMRFIPNVYSPGVQFPSSDSDAVELQKKLLKEAASFIINDRIPDFMNDCIHGTDIPMDGASLRQALHQKGINLRYLGHLILSISQSDLKHQLRHIMRLAFAEIVVRCAQRFFSGYIQGVETTNLSAAASHFLCCLLVPHFSSASTGEESKKRSRRRGRGGGGAADSMAWTALSGNELWSLIGQDAQETYRLKEGLGSNVDHLVEQYGLQKISLLREMCLKTGIQLRLREYILDNRNKAPISPDDVLNILPVVKHITTTTTDATRMFKAAQNSLQKGLLEQAYEQLKEATYLFGRVCDDLHPEACRCLSQLAKVAYVQGHPAEARSVQLRVVVISERVLGFDHPNTIQQYVLLAVYLLAGGETALAQRCLYRAKVLLLTVHGADHPYTAVIDASLGLVLQGEQSLQYLQSALKLNSSFRGDTDLTTALMHHLLAQRLCLAGDYRGGMNHEKEAHSIFQSKYGEDHPQTKCSADFLTNITQQAVRVERSIRQGGAELCDTPPEGLVPSQDTTLEQLALVNGILKTSYSTRMMEFKEKLKERKAAEEAEKKLENSESTNESKDSELQTSNGEDTEETTANVEQTESQSSETDSSEKPDHSKMNGQIESHLHNGDCATKNKSEEEAQQSNITNGVSTESQSKSSNIMTSVNEAQSESAVVNGEECVVKEESCDSEKQVETE
ncbi:LOW QUALITY PROTEIN: clustered mitochondria protein homolog [Onychostoma macrolepis]|uniref:LOW QUALITY PROTEIN: clustered mitochondria protein homolog n=1 Tax=Onychostoma macrolepis TaxID=369639 RepID=UPI00272CB662|nr:LOW QUALITY PROTEIN: clustered mitochondria protein homolog [Onychostoma macrolepis]